MLTLEIRPYTIVGPYGGIYARLLPLCLVLSLNLAHSAGLPIGKEDLTAMCRKTRTNKNPESCPRTCICLCRPQSSIIWMTCRKKTRIFCHRATYAPALRLGNTERGNVVGAIGTVGPDTTHTHRVS